MLTKKLLDVEVEEAISFPIRIFEAEILRRSIRPGLVFDNKIAI